MSQLPFPDGSPSEDARDRATLGGGEGDPAASLSSIGAYMDAEVSELGTLYTDFGDLPESATERFHVFDNASELEDYLAMGGLVFFDSDGSTIPNPIVHILKEFDPDFPEDFQYVVYIDTETQV